MYIFLLFKRLFLKFINFLFGKTWIFILILGWFLVITGILFIIRPERARNKITSHIYGIIKWNILVLCIFVGSGLLSLSDKTTGAISNALFIFATVGTVWMFFLLRKKTRKKLSEKLGLVPIRYLKIFALVQIAVGASMLLLHKRIW
jgi:uncharacterized protein YjeT (DUF2065 family)